MKRVLSGVVILAVVLLIFLLGNKYVVDISMCIIAIRCIKELFHAFEQKGHHPIKWVGYIAAIAIAIMHIIPEQYVTLLMATILPIAALILFIVIISKKNNHNIIDIAITLFGVCYIVLFLMFVPIIREMENGKVLIWYVFIASWLTDVFAYCTGKAIGKHHFTDISPNKTIEGCIGGTLGAIICMLLYTFAANKIVGLNINYLVVALIGFVLSIIGQIGDLAASSIKRYAGIKDFSNFIPGHGGMLDRIDSVIFIAPFAYFLLMFLI